MLKKIESLKLTFVYEIIRPLIFRLELYLWTRRKKLPPTPQLIKHQIIKETANQYVIKTLVETGTYLGNMINANKNNFERIYSIELDTCL